LLAVATAQVNDAEPRTFVFLIETEAKVATFLEVKAFYNM
jgi:hypothetical protein